MQRTRPLRPATTPETRPFRYNVAGRVGVVLKLAESGSELLGTADLLNLFGMRAHFGRWLPPEAPCRLRLEMIDADMALSVRGWVVYSQDGNAAFQFSRIAPKAARLLREYLHPPRADN